MHTTAVILSLFSAASMALAANSTVPEGNSTTTAWVKKQEDISWKNLKANVNPEGAAKGFIAASLSTSEPDYYYTWTRDSALVARVMVNKYNTTDAGDANLLGLLQDYVSFQIKAMGESTVCNCLGEPKFNPDGSSYTGAWGRPQNDGPAERASTFILLADSLTAQKSANGSYVSDTLAPAIYKDVAYVASTWKDACFDLWEEVNGKHMYTLSVMRRALLDGADFASRQGQTANVTSWKSTADAIKSSLEGFFSSDNGYIEVTQDYQNGVQKKGLDVSTLIAANVAGMGDGFYTPGSDEVLATAAAVEAAFSDLYKINQNANTTGLGTAIGRYPEDTYNGVGNSQGNPWFIATNTFAELYYRAILEWQSKGTIAVNSVNAGFFSKFDSSAKAGTTYKSGSTEFDSLIKKVALAADAFLNTVQTYAASNGSMSEQYNRDTGALTGARDLTWSHASMITAANAKLGTPYN